MSEGKLEELIKQKRGFLRQALSDYRAGGNDMLDDVAAALMEAKMELKKNLELASCLREENIAEYEKECVCMFNAWYAKWFGN